MLGHGKKSFYAVSGDLPQAFHIAQQMLDITKEGAVSYCQAAPAVATRGHLAYFQTLSQFYVSYAHAEMATTADRPDKATILREAAVQMQDCLKNEIQIGSRLGMSSRYIVLADVYSRMGEIETGFQLLDKAAEIVSGH